MKFYREAYAEKGGGFEAGIEAALSSILVSPQFLFRLEQDPPNAVPGTAYRISDLELRAGSRFSCGAAFRMMSCCG
jgi:hypothetical protein